jgi:hypothetical protein
MTGCNEVLTFFFLLKGVDEPMEKETGGDLVNRVSVLMTEMKYNEAVLLVKRADSTIENSEM